MFESLKNRVIDAIPERKLIKEKIGSPIEKLFSEHALPLAAAAVSKSEIAAIYALQNDTFVEFLSSKIYPKLPVFAKSVVTEAAFAAFVKDNREYIINKLKAHIEGKSQESKELAQLPKAEFDKGDPLLLTAIQFPSKQEGA